MTRPTIVSSYDITSADDAPGRDPKKWTFDSSFDGHDWVELDVRDDQVFAGRSRTNSYTISNAAAYLFYRLNARDNFASNNSGLQLSEFRVGGPVPAGTLPGTPTIASTNVNGDAVTVSFTAAANATGYYVQRIGEEGKSTVEFLTSATSHTVANLPADSTYIYKVQDINGTLRERPSARGARVKTASLLPPAKDVTALSTYEPIDAFATTGDEGVAKVTIWQPLRLQPVLLPQLLPVIRLS